MSSTPVPTPPARWAWRLTGDRPASALRSAVDRLGATGVRPRVSRVDLSHTADAAAELGAVALREARFLDETGGTVRVCLAQCGEGEHTVLVTTRQPLKQGALAPFVAGLLELSAAQDAAGADRAVTRAGSALTELADATGPGTGSAPGPHHSPPRLELPADRPPPPTRSHRAASVVRRVPAPAGLAAWCTARGLAPHEALAAGLATVLVRYGAVRHPELAVDAPFEGPETGVEPRAVRLPLTGTGTTADLTAQVAQALRQPPEGTHRPDPAACPVLLSCAHRPGPRLTAEGMSAEECAVHSGWTDRDLTVRVEDRDGNWEVRLDHDPEALSAGHAQQLLDRLIALWHQWPHEPGMAALTALTDDERQHVLTDWQGTRRPVPDTCVHPLIEAHARQSPDRLAVVCGTRQLSYGELNRRANRAARRLRELGAGPEDVVAILGDRSVEAVTALLAVLKAGAGYVPVDPAYPEDRIRFVVRDSGARLLLGPAHAVAGLPAVETLTTVELDGPEVLRHSTADLEPLAGPENLAYLIYTSGSTGAPKGVPVSHASLVVSNAARSVGGPPPTVDLLTMPLCFDGSASGMYWTLTGGGTLVLPTDDEVRDPRAVAALADSWPVTHIHSIPSYYALLDDACGGGGLPGLRLVSVGGEPLPPRLVAQHLTRHPEATLLNDYGPTEATIWAAAHHCAGPDATASLVPIGRPLPNYRLYVLDDGLRPTPPGLPGELYIAGPAVARGYHGRPAFTAGSFLPDPYGPAGSRLYRTGDRARQRPDGTLEVLGRADNQVKVRGFRVELGEIEHALLGHPAVAETAVLLHGPADAPQLVAYVATGDGGDPTGRELRSWLATRLPSYMQPDSYLFLPELPRNHNGKIDTHALPSPSRTTAPALRGSTAPAVADLSARQVEEVLRRLLDTQGSTVTYPDR